MNSIVNWDTFRQIPIMTARKPGSAFRLVVARALAELRFQRRSDPGAQDRINRIQEWAKRRAGV